MASFVAFWRVQTYMHTDPARFAGGSNLLPAPDLQRVVLLASVVGVEELLEPLQELKVVLNSFFIIVADRTFFIGWIWIRSEFY